MSREWLAVYAALTSRPKYRRLSPAAKGALFHTWALACAQGPEALWRDLAALVEMLELDGFEAAVVDELVERGWLDVESDGAVWVHDWDVHQARASKAIVQAYEAARKKEWRRAQPSPRDPSPGNRTSHDMTGVRDTSGHVPDAANPWSGYGQEWRPFIEAWTERGFKYGPTIEQRTKLWPIADSRPNEIGAWVRDAPKGVKAAEVVGYVFKQWAKVAAAAP